MHSLGLPWTKDSVKHSVCHSGKTSLDNANTTKGGTNNATPGRGRPRKTAESGDGTGPGGSMKTNKIARGFTAVNDKDVEAEVPAKRPRGRPPKKEPDLEDINKFAVDTPQDRARGRPRKSV